MSLWFRCCAALLFSCFMCSSIEADTPSNLGIDVEIDKGDDATYYYGEPIFISCITNADAYVAIYNIDSEGRLHILFPGAGESGFVPGYETFQIPEQDDDYSLKVTGMHGEEFICAVASTAPLRIPAIFGEETEFRVRGDPNEIMLDIAEDMLNGNEVPWAMDAAHFYVGDEEEVRFPPLPPFPFPPFGFGCLQVVSKPNGAKVFLDGKPFGRTPTAIAGIPPGVHTLVIKKSLYHEHTEKVRIEEGEEERIAVRLKWKLW